jgi:hypothetical protein
MRNYRTEMLMFEVVNFSGLYHVILGWPCYVKFMATPSYAYLKLKIPGPADVFTIEAKAHWALDCEQDSIELAASVVAMAKLRELNLRVPTTPLDPALPSMSSIFKTDEDTKAAHICTRDPAKTVQIGVSLDCK